MTVHADTVEKRGNEYVILSQEGELLEEGFATKEKANERLREIEAAKAARSKDHEDAVWTTAFINTFPDSSFLYIEPGGSKDDEGKTVPRSLRHFPVKGPGGAVDLPHLRNALARIPQSNIPAAAQASASAKARRMLEAARPDGADVWLDGDPIVRRFDYLEFHQDPTRTDGAHYTKDSATGFLRADARPARTGVQTYRDGQGNAWGELRTDDEVFHPDSLASYSLAVVTNDHPAEFVSTRNVKDVAVGSVGDAKRDGRFVRVPLVIQDAATIRAIEDGKVQLSCGYTAVVVRDSGEFQGQRYAGRQTNIRINHVALVDRGRAGPECSVLARGDAFHLPTDEVAMKTVKIKIGDQEFEVPEQVRDAFEAKRDNPDLAELQGKLDVVTAKLEAQEQSFSARVDERSQLVAAAQRHGVPTTDEKGARSDAAIMADVVVKALPSMATKLEQHKGDAGYLRACFDQAVEMCARRDEETARANTVLFDALKGDGKTDPFEDALTSYANRAKGDN